MVIFFVYYFFAAGTYDVDKVRTQALYTNHRPIRTMAECRRQAYWRQLAQLDVLENGSGPYVDVLVICEEEPRK